MNNSNLNLEKQQRKTVLPCPVCGKSLRKEFFFRERNDRFICCSSCKTELQINLRRKETAVFIAIALVVMGIFSGLFFGLQGSWRWLAVIVFPLSFMIQLYMPAKCIYLTCKDSKESSPFSPEGIQRQSKLRKTQLFNMVTLSLAIAIIVASVVAAVVFPAVSWDMSIFILVCVFVVVFLISFMVQHRRQEQRDNNFFKGNDLTKWANPQAKPQSNRRKSPRLIVWILIIFIVILQTILLAMVCS